MKDIVMAVGFLAILIAPVIAAAFSGKEKQKTAGVDEIERPEEALPEQSRPAISWEAQTLPFHRTMGMARR